jgi:hypothetical protein
MVKAQCGDLIDVYLVAYISSLEKLQNRKSPPDCSPVLAVLGFLEPATATRNNERIRTESKLRHHRYNCSQANPPKAFRKLSGRGRHLTQERRTADSLLLSTRSVLTPTRISPDKI